MHIRTSVRCDPDRPRPASHQASRDRLAEAAATVACVVIYILLAALSGLAMATSGPGWSWAMQG